jgi:RNA-binding protein YhbY
MPLIKLQIGKNGLTNEFIEKLRKVFVNNDHVRINLLKSSGRDRQKTKEWAEKIVSSLGTNYRHKIIGFTIALRKWRRAKAF